MSDTIDRTIELENNTTLEIHDMSRKIGADAWVVRMKATIDFQIKESLFTQDLPDDISFDKIHEALGDAASYKYEVERNFIMDHEKDGVFESLVQTFLNNLGQYVAKPGFPEKFVLKEYQDAIK